MRKTSVVTLVILALLGIGTYVFLVNPFSGDTGALRELSKQFMEDLQFKDFRRSSLYHHKLEKDRVDIGNSLEKLFLVKPEFMDIREYRVVSADIDSTGDRARVHVKTRFKRLNVSDKVEEGELILYWLHRHPDCPIGSLCVTNICMDEGGKKLYSRDLKSKKPKLKAEDEEEPEPLSCDPLAEKQWFMNLDSTLKEKKYNY